MPAGPTRLWLVAAITAAAALRVCALNKPFYIDEIVTITVAVQPLHSMSAVMRQIDASPALYPLLLHCWMLVSHAQPWVRLLSALFGVLTVPVVACLAARAFDWRAGVAAAWVIAIAPIHVQYSQYVRGYSLFALLAAAHVLVFADFLDVGRTIRRGNVLIFIVLTTALFYTHYLSPLLLAAEGVVLLFYWKRSRTRLVVWAIAISASGVLFIPGVPLLLHNVEFDRIRNLDRPNAPPMATLLPDIMGELSVGQRRLGFSNPITRRVTLAAAAVVFCPLCFLGIVRGWRRQPEMVVLFVAVLAVPLLIYLGSGRRLVAVRFFVPFTAGYAALLGCGLASLRQTRLAVAAALLAILSAVPLWHFSRHFTWSYDHRQVAAAMTAASRDSDVILVVHPYEAFYYSWYLGNRLPIAGLVFTALTEQGGYVIKPPALEFGRARSRILEIARQHPRFWFVGQSNKSFASNAREEARILEWLDETYDRGPDLGVLTGNDPVIRLYVTRMTPAAGSPHQ
jgi:mannosyltransferase